MAKLNLTTIESPSPEFNYPKIIWREGSTVLDLNKRPVKYIALEDEILIPSYFGIAKATIIHRDKERAVARSGFRDYILNYNPEYNEWEEIFSYPWNMDLI